MNRHERRTPKERAADGQAGLGGNGSELLVVGDQSAAGLAATLADDYDVTLVSDEESVVRTARTRGIDARRADLTDGSELRGNADSATAAVVAARRDRVNLLVAQLLRASCGVDDVVVRINDPENREIFEDIDVELLDGGSLLAPKVERALFGEDA